MSIRYTLLALLTLANLQASNNNTILIKEWNKQTQLNQIYSLYDPNNSSILCINEEQNKLKIALQLKITQNIYKNALAIELKDNTLSHKKNTIIQALSILACGGYAKKSSNTETYHKLVNKDTFEYLPKIRYLLLQETSISQSDILKSAVRANIQSCQDIKDVTGQLKIHNETLPTLIVNLEAWLNYANGNNWPKTLPIKEIPHLNYSIFGTGTSVEWSPMTKQEIMEQKIIHAKRNFKKPRISARM